MGTSSSNRGPKKSSQLLPSWAIPNIESPINSDTTPTENIEPSENTNQKVSTEPKLDSLYSQGFGGAKSSLTNYIKQPSRKKLKSAGKNYVRAYGGSKKALIAAYPGVSYGGGYANFLSSISNIGFSDTLKQIGLSDCIGKSYEEVVVKIADKIAPDGGTNQDSIVRKAMLSSIEVLLEKFSSDTDKIETINNLSKDDVKESLIEFVSFYVFYKWLYELGITLEQKNISEKDVIDLEENIKDFIHGEIKLSLKDIDISEFDFTKGEGKQIIEKVFEQAYSTLEK